MLFPTKQLKSHMIFLFVYFHAVGIVNPFDVDTGHLELWMLLLQNDNKINTLTNSITEK